MPFGIRYLLEAGAFICLDGTVQDSCGRRCLLEGGTVWKEVLSGSTRSLEGRATWKEVPSGRTHSLSGRAFSQKGPVSSRGTCRLERDDVWMQVLSGKRNHGG